MISINYRNVTIKKLSGHQSIEYVGYYYIL